MDGSGFIPPRVPLAQALAALPLEAPLASAWPALAARRRVGRSRSPPACSRSHCCRAAGSAKTPAPSRPPPMPSASDSKSPR